VNRKVESQAQAFAQKEDRAQGIIGSDISSSRFAPQKRPVRSTTAKSSRERVRAYRERMRKRGMKVVQIWVPDPKSSYFAAQARRQSRFIAESPEEKDGQAFIYKV
jgi:hypothetical protein